MSKWHWFQVIALQAFMVVLYAHDDQAHWTTLFAVPVGYGVGAGAAHLYFWWRGKRYRERRSRTS